MKTADVVGFTIAILLGFFLTIIFINHVSEKKPDAVHSDSVTYNVLHVQCEDEHEPVVTKLANSTEIVVTCEAK
jgi:hypothetical protein